MDSESKLIEGLTQAMYLTKCVLMDDVMPQSVKQLSGDVSIPNQDERVIQVFVMWLTRKTLMFFVLNKIVSQIKLNAFAGFPSRIALRH